MSDYRDYYLPATVLDCGCKAYITKNYIRGSFKIFDPTERKMKEIIFHCCDEDGCVEKAIGKIVPKHIFNFSHQQIINGTRQSEVNGYVRLSQ